MRLSGRNVLLAAWLFSLAAGSAGSSRAEELLYFEQEGQIVFTNTPSRPDAKPVPGFAATPLRSKAALPSTPYDRFIDRVASENALDPALIKAVALVESGFNPQAVSPKGAKGIMQLMPGTARRYGVADPHDPHESLRAGAQHLRDLLDEFDGNVALALAAYNAGAGAVRRHGGIPAYRETQDYVRKVQGRLSSPKRNTRAATASPRPVSRVELELQADGSVVLSN